MIPTPLDALMQAMTPEEWAGTDHLTERVAAAASRLAASPATAVPLSRLDDRPAATWVNCDGNTAQQIIYVALLAAKQGWVVRYDLRPEHSRIILGFPHAST